MMMQCTKATSNNNSRVVIKKPVFSCSLNLNQVDLDKLKAVREERGEEAENDFYRELAARYMKGMGYGSQPYIVYKHEDIERTHIHIISIRVDRNRRKINDSNEKLRSERVRKEIAQVMGLSDLLRQFLQAFHQCGLVAAAPTPDKFLSGHRDIGFPEQVRLALRLELKVSPLTLHE